jgi:hypothetical protein
MRPDPLLQPLQLKQLTLPQPLHEHGRRSRALRLVKDL